MKMHNKKRGFTIVELVIVIAVIAILSAVMVPTFSGIVNKAKKSAAEQEATAAVRAVVGTTEYGTLDVEDVDVDAYVIVNEDYAFALKAGKLEATTVPADTTYANVAAAKDAGKQAGDVVYIAHSENEIVYVYHVLTAADLA